jgi:hypothetical protein
MQNAVYVCAMTFVLLYRIESLNLRVIPNLLQLIVSSQF